MKTTIPIFFTIDKDYAPYLSVAIASLIENASLDYNYNIHVVYESITEESIAKLKTLETENAKIIFTEMHYESERKFIKSRYFYFNYLFSPLYSLYVPGI